MTLTKDIRQLTDLTPDPHNANLGTERGTAMLEQSLRQYGAGRSILADKNGMIIAGNKTLEQAAALGLAIEVIKTDGTKLVVVQREDLDLTTDTSAKALAVVDNRAAELNIKWSAKVLKQLGETIELDSLFTPYELEKLDWGKGGPGAFAGEADQSGELKEKFNIMIECRSEQEQVTLLQRLTEEGYACRSLIT